MIEKSFRMIELSPLCIERSILSDLCNDPRAINELEVRYGRMD